LIRHKPLLSNSRGANEQKLLFCYDLTVMLPVVEAVVRAGQYAKLDHHSAMGYDLSNASGAYVRFSGSGWDLALATARHYGWQPAGIPKPESWNENTDGPWEDEYWLNCRQQVTASDAAALAVALDRAVTAVDLVETMLRLKDETNHRLIDRYPQWQDDLKPISREEVEKFRARLAELAALAHQGAFVIE
jgi:hypothetical protein